MNDLTLRTPETIATEIESIKGQTRDIILHSSVEIGRRLVEAKAVVTHGDWGDWLKNSVDYSQSTANNLMAIYREYGDKIGTLGNLSYTKALALLGVPDGEREQFVAENDVDNLSAKELQRAIKEKQKLEQQLKQAKDSAEKERVAAQNLALRYAELERKGVEHDALVQRLTAEIEEAKLTGEDDEAWKLQEELQKSKNELAATQTRVTELETELSQKLTDISGVVERVPVDVEQELADLRKQVAVNSTQATVKFKYCFDSLVRNFQEVLAALNEVQTQLPDSHEKYLVAVRGLLGKMSERL